MKANLRSLFARSFFALLLVGFAISLSAQAQTVTNSQPVNDSLSMLPESEMVFFVNAPRIINDAMPRLLPDKDYQEMRKGLDGIKAFTGVDLKNMEYLVLAMRFNKPTGGKIYPLPEAMFAARGDFDAKALLNMAMTFSEGKLREEAYGTHTLNILKLDDVSKDASKNPFGAAFAEIALTTLDANTIAIGNSAYIKAALDAADGRGRIKPELIASLMRDPGALISIDGSPLMAFARSFGLRIAENKDPNCMTRFGDFHTAITMDAQNFKLMSALNADNPETAGIIKNMLAGVFQQTKGMIPDKNAQTFFDQMKVIIEGSEILVEASIPQETAAKYVREMLAPKPKTSAAAIETKATAPKPAEPKATGKKPRNKK